MSNLVPTPRTDRNGRTQIRHLRPDHATGSAAGRIPPPASPTAAVPSDVDPVELALSLVGGNTRADSVDRELLTFLDDVASPGILTFLSGLSEGVSATAREGLANGLKDILDRLHDCYEEIDDPEVVRDSTSIVFHPGSRNHLAMAREAGALRGDVGAPPLDREGWKEFVALVSGADADVRRAYREADSTGDSRARAQWRGLAAFVLVDDAWKVLRELWRDENRGLIQRFAEHVAASPNPALIVEAARETGSFVPEHLDHLIRARQSVAPAVRDGAL